MTTNENLERKRVYIISGRIDLQVEIEPVEFDAMANKAPGESSEAIRRRVLLARAVQQERYKNLKGVNADGSLQFSAVEAASLPILVSHISEAIGYRSLDRASYGTTY